MTHVVVEVVMYLESVSLLGSRWVTFYEGYFVLPLAELRVNGDIMVGTGIDVVTKLGDLNTVNCDKGMMPSSPDEPTRPSSISSSKSSSQSSPCGRYHPYIRKKLLYVQSASQNLSLSFSMSFLPGACVVK